MLAAAALGALGAQLEQLQAAKQDWFVGASLVDEQDISLEADGAVTVRRQAFDKALRNFPKTDSPSKAKAARKMEVTDYDQVIAGERFCSRSERQALASAAATTWWSSTSVSRVRRVINGPPPVGLPLRQKAKGAAAALEGRLAGVEWGVLAALAA